VWRWLLNKFVSNQNGFEFTHFKLSCHVICHVQGPFSLEHNFRHPLFSCLMHVRLWIIQWVILISHIFSICMPNSFRTKINLQGANWDFPTLPWRYFANEKKNMKSDWALHNTTQIWMRCGFAISYFNFVFYSLFTLNVRKKRLHVFWYCMYLNRIQYSYHKSTKTYEK